MRADSNPPPGETGARARAAATKLPRRSLLAMALLPPLLAACDLPTLGPGKAPSFHAVDITGSGIGNGLALPDLEGRTRNLADFAGQVVVVFFGYTQCPDVCPTTMAELAQLRQSLGKAGERLQVVFVTVDPERDSTEILQRYMASFDPSFVALRGSLEQTAATAKDFKLYYAKVPGARPDSYTVDHTAGAFVFDPSGRPRLFVRYGSDPAHLRQDIQTLLAA